MFGVCWGEVWEMCWSRGVVREEGVLGNVGRGEGKCGESENVGKV